MAENEILQQILLKLGSIDQHLEHVDQRLDGMDQRLDGMDQRIDGISSELQQVKVTLETVTNKKIDLLYESYETILQKLEKVNEIDGIKDRVGNLERVVLHHTDQIEQLKKAL